MGIIETVVAESNTVRKIATEKYEAALVKKAISLTDGQLIEDGLKKDDLEENDYNEKVGENLKILRESHKGIAKGVAIILGLDLFL